MNQPVIINPSEYRTGFWHRLGMAFSILGNSQKFNFSTQYRQITPQATPIDCSYGNLMRVAQNVPHFNMVVSRGAEMFSQMEICHYSKKGEEIEDSPYVDFLSSPNPMQTLSEMAYEWYINDCVYRINLGYKNQPSKLSKIPAAIWMLQPGEIEIKTTGKMYDQVDISGIISGYYNQVDGRTYTTDEVTFMRSGMAADGILPTSPIKSLQMPLSNLVAIMKSFNIITTERGQIGFFSPETKSDNDGALPFNEKEMTRFQNDYQRRAGLDSSIGHVAFSNQPLKWTPMPFDVGQLKLFEGSEDALQLICGTIGLRRDIFPRVDGSTYENQNQAEKATYGSHLQPLANRFVSNLGYMINLPKGEYLKAEFDDVPVMQENKKEKAEAQKTVVDSIRSLVDANIITPSQAQVLVAMHADIVADPALANTDKVVSKLAELSPLVANNMLSNLTVNEVRGILSLPKIQGGDVLSSAQPVTPNVNA